MREGGEGGQCVDESLAPQSWLSELALSQLTTVEWMGRSDGCLNRLIVLVSQEIRTDGWINRERERGGGGQGEGEGEGGVELTLFGLKRSEKSFQGQETNNQEKETDQNK